MTTFRYVDVQREMVKQLVSDKEKQCFWFAMWAQECGFLGSNNNASQSGGPVNMQDQGQTKEQESLQFLQLLVYTAAETDAQEFIEMIFSTSAGRIIFNSYKDKTPLPEHVARANGHSNLAQYLQDVNTRLSKEVSSEVQSNAIDWLELEKAVQKQVAVAQGKSIKQENCRSESDDNSSDYFAGAKTSSQGSSDIDEWSQSASDSDSSIGTEPCNEAELSIEGLSKRPTNHKEDSSSETPFEEEKLPDNKEERDTLGWGFTDGLSQWLGKGRKREASAAKPLDSKDKIPFEEMKLPDSQEDRDTLGWRFTDSPSQWLSKKKKKKKKEDERNSTTFRMFLLATFLCLRHASSFFFRLLSSFFFDTSGQANVHSTGNTQVVTDYLEAQRAQIEDFTVFNMQKIVTKNADIAYYLKPTESARRRPDLEEGDVIDFLTNAKMGQTEIEKQSYENSPRALMSDVIGLSAQIVITNHIFQERMQVKFEDTMIKDRSRWLKGLTWKLVLLLIIAAVFTTILYMLLAPCTLSQYQMCKKGSIKDHTAYFENFGIDQYLKVNGIEFTWEKLTEKLDIHDCAKYNATGMRYYLNLERCAYFGKILLDHKPQIRGPELFALNDKCSKVYYVECDIHKWKQYTTAVNIKCSPPN